MQQKVIPAFKTGKDLIVLASPGSGKTASYCIGILQQIDLSLDSLQAIVICPNRDLGRSIAVILKQLGDYMGVKVSSLGL